MEMPVPNPAVLARKARVVERLSAVLPASVVIHDERETRAYECDALTAYRCPPMVAVLPSTTEEVSAVLRICHEGCGYFINLVVTGEQRGNLWLDGRVSEAGIFPIDYYGTGKPVKFLDWYLVWLDASIKKLQEKLP